MLVTLELIKSAEWIRATGILTQPAVLGRPKTILFNVAVMCLFAIPISILGRLPSQFRERRDE